MNDNEKRAREYFQEKFRLNFPGEQLPELIEGQLMYLTGSTAKRKQPVNHEEFYDMLDELWDKVEWHVDKVETPVTKVEGGTDSLEVAIRRLNVATGLMVAVVAVNIVHLGVMIVKAWVS